MPGPRAVIANLLRPVLKALEGEPRPGPHFLPISGGWLPAGAPMNWWQTGMSPASGERSAIVEACISAYAQTVAMCPGDHWRANNRGGRDRVTTSSLSRILRHPNDYQSISDFLLNTTRSLYLTGNAYALALRNDRYEVDELHLMDSDQSSPQVVRANNEFSGEIFYRLGGNSVIEQRLASNEHWHRAQLMVPARDVMHIRLHSDRRYPHPLVGSSPLVAAYGDLATYQNIKNQQDQFYQNRAAPSAVLTTDLVLDKDQVQALRDRWNEQAKGLHAGGVPVLTGGLKVTPWIASAVARDMQVAELLKLANENIALVFRIPLQILGLGGAPFSSTQALMQFWLASGLGFCLNNIEQAFDRVFGLAGEPENYTEFNTAALLRSDQKDRIEALVRAVQGGVFSPNEARNQEGYDSVPFGDSPRVQAQVIPLEAAGAIPTPPVPNVPPVAPSAKDYRAAMQRDIEALNARAERPARTNGVAEPHGHLIRKTKLNGLQRGAQ